MKSLLLLFAGAGVAFAGDARQAASAVSPQPQGPWTLFNPTPVELMRDFETDRPDTTESPRTVPAGHFQAEISLYDFTHDKTDGVTTRSDLFGAFNLKLGLLNNVDLQFVFDGFTQERITEGGVQTTTEGFSDLTTRLKVNLWGNDGGRTAMAFFPYLKIPTGSSFSNDKVEGGIILPFGADISETNSVGVMVQPEFVYEEATDGYDLDVLHSVVLGTALGEQWGNYLEYFGISGGEYQAYGSGGFTYAPLENVQFDIGVRVGLNEAAEDFGIFTGVSLRY